MIFCDFDGTITAKDTLEAFIESFIGPDIWTISERMLKEGYTVKRGIKELMGMIRSEDYLNGLHLFKDLPIREGFGEFLDCCGSLGIPVVVLSGGIKEMTEEALAPYMDKIHDLWAGSVDTSGEYIRFYSDYETETELMGKINIIKRYDFEKVIAIGDSYTDFEMGSFADITFARDRLAAALENDGKPFFPFETFCDIIPELQKLFGGE